MILYTNRRDAALVEDDADVVRVPRSLHQLGPHGRGADAAHEHGATDRAPDHVAVDHGHDVLERMQRVFGPVATPDQPQLLPRRRGGVGAQHHELQVLAAAHAHERRRVSCCSGPRDRVEEGGTARVQQQRAHAAVGRLRDDRHARTQHAEEGGKQIDG